MNLVTNLKSYKLALNSLNRKFYPAVMRNTLNTPPKAIVKKSRAYTKERLNVRVPYTLKGIRQDRYAKGDNTKKMFSRVGMINPYLVIQDRGGRINAESQKIPIPFLSARKGNIMQSIETKYRMNKLGALKSSKKFFLGVPKGNGKPSGIWERLPGNKMRRIRSLSVSTAFIKPRRIYRDAEKRYATIQYMKQVFIKEANGLLGKITRTVKP